MRTATLEIDTDSGAGYLRMRELRVAHTQVIQEWPLLAVDYSAKGAVVGVEAVGFENFDVVKLLKLARVSNADQFAAQYRLRVTTKRRELAVA